MALAGAPTIAITPRGAKQPEVCVVVVRSGNGVDDQVELAGQALEGVPLRHHEVRCAEPARVSLLGLGAAQDGHLGPHRRGELDRHVTQSAESHHAHAIAGLAAELAQRRIGGDSCAEQRSGPRQVEVGGHAQGEALVHYDLGRVSTVGERLPIHLGAVVRHGRALLAELLETFRARSAGAAGVDHAPHAREIPLLEPGDLAAESRHAPHDLMARNHRENASRPFVARLVDVRVTHSGEHDFNDDVVRSRLTALDSHGRERLARSGNSPSMDLLHCLAPV